MFGAREFFQFLRPIKNAWKQFQNSWNSFKYLNLPSRSPSPFAYNANLLVVKNPLYANFAQICVESFLHHNPLCKVEIHCDESTEERVKVVFSNLMRKGKVKMSIIDNCEITWQELKLDLILNMKSKSEFFMDADLRWNGPIPQIQGPTFFVKEFSFSTKAPYSDLTSMRAWNFGKEIQMKNTSFVAWATYPINPKDIELVREVMKLLEDFCDSSLSHADAEAMTRISEQIALSVLAEFIEQPVGYLKEKDTLRDGGFVESSYFGATGSYF